MIDLLVALAVVIVFASCHILCVKFRILGNGFGTAVRLLVISFLVLFVFFLFREQGILTHASGFGGSLKWTSTGLYALFSLFYIAQFLQLPHESISLMIVRRIETESRKEITCSQIRDMVTNEKVLLERLNDLVLHGHIELKDGKYIATVKGARIARLMGWYRNLLGRGLGG